MDDTLTDTRNTLTTLIDVTRRDWQIGLRHGQPARPQEGDHYPWPTARAPSILRRLHLHNIGHRRNG